MITKDGYQIDCLAIEPDRVDLSLLAFPDYKCATCGAIGYFADRAEPCECKILDSKPVFCGWENHRFSDVIHAMRFSALVYYYRAGMITQLEIKPRFIVPWTNLSGRKIPTIFKALFAYTTNQKNRIVEIWDPMIDHFFDQQAKSFMEKYPDRNLVIFAKGSARDGRKSNSAKF